MDDGVAKRTEVGIGDRRSRVVGLVRILGGAYGRYSGIDGGFVRVFAHVTFALVS